MHRKRLHSWQQVLSFLHADCFLPGASLLKIRDVYNNLSDLIGGAFTMRIAGKRFFYRILSIGGNLYCRITRIFFGDRVMFIKKDAFWNLGGFRSLEIMSDFDLSRRMKKAGRAWSIFAFLRGVDTRIINKIFTLFYQVIGKYFAQFITLFSCNY